MFGVYFKWDLLFKEINKQWKSELIKYRRKWVLVRNGQQKNMCNCVIIFFRKEVCEYHFKNLMLEEKPVG